MNTKYNSYEAGSDAPRGQSDRRGGAGGSCSQKATNAGVDYLKRRSIYGLNLYTPFSHNILSERNNNFFFFFFFFFFFKKT